MRTTIPPVIVPDDIKDLFDQGHVVLVDARGGPDAYQRYQAGHLPKAIFIDLETGLSAKGPDPATGGRHPLPDPETFGLMLGRMGVTPANHILVYDDKSGANAAARFWWMMKAAGHAFVQVIDGGLTALQQSGFPMENGSVASLVPAEPYPLHQWNRPLVDLGTVDSARTDPRWLVIDVREGYRYRGESEPIDLVAGHIPGAINIPYIDNLEPDGRFRSAEILREAYRKVIGTEEPKKVIVHCGSGVTACHTLLALEQAGMEAAHLYVGSWSEWSRNRKPVARGENP